MRIILGLAMLLTWIWAACSFEIREVRVPIYGTEQPAPSAARP